MARRPGVLALVGMRLNKQRKVYLGLLAVAGIALAADQMFFGVSGPQAASAAVQTPGAAVPATPTAAGQPAPAASATNAHMAGAARLAQLLNSLSRDENLNAASTSDAFAIPPEWLPVASKPETDNSQPEAADEAGKTTTKSPVVTAIMAGGTRPAAIVNGRLMTVGDAHAGITLVAVEPGIALLRTPDGVVHPIRVVRPNDSDR